MKYKRIFILVMDSVGIGSDTTSYLYNDDGANTLKHIANKSNGLHLPNLESLGLGDLDDIKGVNKINHPHAFSMKLKEYSNGKDTLTGHWEMMGVYTKKPFKTFTDTGFPSSLISELEKRTGHKSIGNKAASGTEILVELGEKALKENALIIYTSSDSVLQICGHEKYIGLDNLYKYCEIARELCMKEEYKVARVIARPYLGETKETFKRTPNRHDYALKPPVDTVMNILKDNGLEVSCVGKIADIFSNSGVTKSVKTVSNTDGMNKTIDIINNDDFKGICFVNLVEFDQEYGHRRDVSGYKAALEQFDIELKEVLESLKDDDLLLITADHGNDPTWHGTDHTREKVPLLVYSKSINTGSNLKERNSFSDIGATILYNFNLSKPIDLLGERIKEI